MTGKGPVAAGQARHVFRENNQQQQLMRIPFGRDGSS